MKPPFFSPFGQGIIAALPIIASFSLLQICAMAQVEFGNSETEFSGIQGQNDWYNGYRNLSADGGGRAGYDAVADFNPYSGGDAMGVWDGNAQQWTGTAWDLNTAAAAPWTFTGALANHPNQNGFGEHWSIRRWTAGADITGPTPVEAEWFIAKTASGGQGTTAQLHRNGVLVGSSAIAGTDIVGVTKSAVFRINVGDHIDLALTPVGLNGNTADGSDNTNTRLIIRTVVDTEPDGLPDAWEEIYFPGDLNQLFTGGDFDGDLLNDELEFDRGSNPTLADTDGDGLNDLAETNDLNYVSPTQTGTNPNAVDSDADGLSDFDEIFGAVTTNPTLFDTDMDTFSDGEEVFFVSDPNDINDTPLSLVLADSRIDFSGVDGQAGWRWGYRNYTADGKGTDYDAGTDFIPFPVDGTTTRTETNFWNGTSYDWQNAAAPHNPPWTELANEATHPNGTNNAEEHWTVRRWAVSGLAAESPVAVVWHTRKGNAANDGVTGSIHLNGTEVDTVTLPGTDTIGFIRFYYLNVVNGDIIDEILSPEGIANRSDGSDGSANWMRIDGRIPDGPRQPDGRYFIPVNSVDSEPDGLADFWENEYFPGDLTPLFTGNDFDGDGALDEEEQAASTDPTLADTDGDKLSDGDELHFHNTDPYVADTDGDGCSDGHEVGTGHDPNDPADNLFLNPIANSMADFPANGELNAQGINDWTYGYYDTTTDGEPSAGDQEFIPFPTDGSTTLSGANFWSGAAFDWFNDPPNAAGNAHNPPWTFLATEEGHPNGDNNQTIHWATRRWTVSGNVIPSATPVALNYHLRATNLAGGGGTTIIVMHNGERLDKLTVGGTDGVGVKSYHFVVVSPGDNIEIALSPEDVNGTFGDGSDGSAFWLVVDPLIPMDPKQPDGTPFLPFGDGSPIRITDVFYDEPLDEITLTWTTTPGKEYQVQISSNLVNWTFIGSTVTTNTITLESVPKGPQFYRVQELEP
jgi:hypothetical protein